MSRRFRLASFIALALALVTACGEEDSADPNLVVWIKTAGTDPDPDGYSLSLQEAGTFAVSSTDTVRLRVAAGDYVLPDDVTDMYYGPGRRLALSGLASNCLSEHSMAAVNVGHGTVDTVGFTVTCTAVAATDK